MSGDLRHVQISNGLSSPAHRRAIATPHARRHGSTAAARDAPNRPALGPARRAAFERGCQPPVNLASVGFNDIAEGPKLCWQSCVLVLPQVAEVDIHQLDSTLFGVGVEQAHR
jgi:hypothetical protein